MKKKILCSVLSLALVASLTACGSSPKETVTPKENPTQVEKTVDVDESDESKEKVVYEDVARPEEDLVSEVKEETKEFNPAELTKEDVVNFFKDKTMVMDENGVTMKVYANDSETAVEMVSNGNSFAYKMDDKHVYVYYTISALDVGDTPEETIKEAGFYRVDDDTYATLLHSEKQADGDDDLDGLTGETFSIDSLDGVKSITLNDALSTDDEYAVDMEVEDDDDALIYTLYISKATNDLTKMDYSSPDGEKVTMVLESGNTISYFDDVTNATEVSNEDMAMAMFSGMLSVVYSGLEEDSFGEVDFDELENTDF